VLIIIYILGLCVFTMGNSVKNSVFAGIFWVMAMSPALAQTESVAPKEEFYLEIGNDVPKAEIENTWKNLVAAHKAQLAKLKLFPKDIITGGVVTGARIQAGPIAAKIKAQKICNRLFADQVPCFVIEGLTEMPPSSTSSLNDTGFEQAPGEFVRLPWLEEQPPLREAEVHVAEAIRVPLAEENTVTVPMPTPIVAQPLPEPEKPIAADSQYDNENDQSGPGWLSVGAFLNAEVARAFWDEVGPGVPAYAKGLRVRIIQPLVETRNNQATLHIGAFKSSKDAYEFCREHIQAGERGLSCRFSLREPGVDAAQDIQTLSRSEAYAKRRRPMGNPAPAAQ